MAFKHYQGPTARPAPWICPSCHTEQVTPFEDGCTACGVGGDAAHVGVPLVPEGKADKVEGPAQHVPSALVQHAALAAGRWTPPSSQIPQLGALEEAFQAWALTQADPPMDVQLLGRRAFLAGWDAAVRSLQPLSVPMPLGDHRHPQPAPSSTAAPSTTGATLYITSTDPSSLADLAEVDSRTAATIIAALVFYKDNQLGYGEVPGQLTAQEVSELVGRLEPATVRGGVEVGDVDIPF